MGFELEFNWYLVAKESNPSYMEFVKTDKAFTITKEGYRVYPVNAVVPFIVNEEAISLVYIKSQMWDDGETILRVEPVVELVGEIKEHYESMYKHFKEKQEKEDHGGKVDYTKIVNGAKRLDFNKALKETGQPIADYPGVEVEWKDN